MFLLTSLSKNIPATRGDRNPVVPAIPFANPNIVPEKGERWNRLEKRNRMKSYFRMNIVTYFIII